MRRLGPVCRTASRHSAPFLQLAPVLALLTAAACGDAPVPEQQAAKVAIRDSADVEIVENHAPEWESDDFWTAGVEPEFVLGGYRGASADDPSAQVWQVGGAAPLSDGSVAVLARGVSKVLVFERSGALVTSFGGQGRGPGEFSYPLHFQVLPEDTIVVWDYMGVRTDHLFRSFRVDSQGAKHRPRRGVRCDPDGHGAARRVGGRAIARRVVPDESLPQRLASVLRRALQGAHRVCADRFRVRSAFLWLVGRKRGRVNQPKDSVFSAVPDQCGVGRWREPVVCVHKQWEPIRDSPVFGNRSPAPDCQAHGGGADPYYDL